MQWRSQALLVMIWVASCVASGQVQIAENEGGEEALTAPQILDRMTEVYANCKSYRDSGVVKTLVIHPENWLRNRTTEGPFKTAFIRADRFRFEMDHFAEHYVLGLRRVTPPNDLLEALHALADRAAETPRRVFCHRDFHSRNLMVLADESLALVDIQDARWGPDSYDLASLLRDAYIDIDESWIDPLVELYVATLGEAASEGFRTRLDCVSVQRMIKALGTFGYQATVRRERRYLESIPRTVVRLRTLLPNIAQGPELLKILDGDGLLASQQD